MGNKDIKICLSMDQRSSVFGYAIATLLRERYQVKTFYDIGCRKKDEAFFKFQKEFSYTPLFIKEELDKKAKEEKIDISYLKSLGEEYGLPNLWPYITMDRYFMVNHQKTEYLEPRPALSHDQMLKHLQVYFREIKKSLEQALPDVIIFEAVGSTESYILYQIAKKMGIRTIILDHFRIGNWVILNDNCYNIFSKANEIFELLRKGSRQSRFNEEARVFLKRLLEEPSSPYYDDASSKFPSFFNKLSKVARYFIEFSKEGSSILYLKRHWIKSWRKFTGSGLVFEKPKKGEDFAFFPLHFEPELATLLLAPFYVNQIALIQNIAKSLPVHFKLYVKEHPAMLYYRFPSYFKELKKIPNVRLIDTRVNSFDLIRESKIVLTITGTAGWEAVLLKKPIITFGSCFYNKLPQVQHSDNIEELPSLIKESLENHQHNEEELTDFISAILETSLPLDYMKLCWSGSVSSKEILEDQDFHNFVAVLAKEFKLRPLE